MPTFEFTSPQGKTYEVQGPEGATADQAFQILQRQLGAGAPTQSPDARPAIGSSKANQIPTSGYPQAPKSDRPPELPEDSFGKKLLAYPDMMMGLGAGALMAPVSQVGGIAGTLASGQYGTPQGIKAGEDVMRRIQSMAYQPRTKTASDVLGAISDLTDKSKLGAVVPDIPRVAPFAKTELAPPAVLNAAKKTEQAVKDVPKAFKPDPETLALARKAKSYGIPLRPDMLSDKKIVRMMGEAAEQVPLSGSKTQQRQEAFNKALISQIGGDAKATKLTPQVFQQALDKSGGAIGRIYAKTTISGDKFSKLDQIAKKADAMETTDNAKIVKGYVAEVKDKIKGATATSEKKMVVDKDGNLVWKQGESKTTPGTIDGTVLRKLDSDIGDRIRSVQDSDLRNNLRQIQDVMRDALNSSLKDEADKAALKQARTQYAKALTLEPLVAKSPTGNVSPAGLMAAMTATKTGKRMMARGKAGDMGDLARIGQRFLKEPPSSGTAERALAYGTFTGGLSTAAYFHPKTVAALYAGANLYNRLGPDLTDIFIATPPPKKP